MFWLKSSRSSTGTWRDFDTASPCAPWWRSPACSDQPSTTTDHGFQQGQSAEQHAAAAHEADRARDVARLRKTTLAQCRSLPQHPGVGVRTTEYYAKGAGEGCLGHARVRARGERAVAVGDAQR